MSSEEDIFAALETTGSPDASFWSALEEVSNVSGENVPRLMQVLRRLLQHDLAVVRSQTLYAVHDVGAVGLSEDVVRLLLSDADPMVRASAAEVLGGMRAVESASRLCEALGDQDDTVRAYAAAALGRSGDSAMIPHLRAHASEASLMVRLEVLVALVLLGDDKATELARCIETVRGLDEVGQALNVVEVLGSVTLPASVRRVIADALVSLRPHTTGIDLPQLDRIVVRLGVQDEP